MERCKLCGQLLAGLPYEYRNHMESVHGAVSGRPVYSSPRSEDDGDTSDILRNIVMPSLPVDPPSYSPAPDFSGGGGDFGGGGSSGSWD